MNDSSLLLQAVVCNGLVKRFGSTLAVSGLTLAIGRGGIYALLGRNGAGKTTTLRMLAGQLRPDSGDAIVNGHAITVDSPVARRMLAFLPDEPLLYAKLTPLEHMEFFAGLWSIPAQTAKLRAESLLRLFDLWEHRSVRAEGLSRGMRQKTALCIALLHEPTLLIMDEPLTGLDVTSARQVKDLMRDFARSGGTVLISSHQLDMVERLADRIAILSEGRLLMEGTLDELRAGASGASGGASLEDLFLELTRPVS